MYILIAIEPKDKMEIVEKKILRFPKLYELMEVLGRYEIMAKFRLRDKDQLAKILDRLNAVDGVKDYLVLIVTRKLKS